MFDDAKRRRILLVMTFKSLLDLWPSRPHLARRMGLPKVTVDMWYWRDSIPPEHWLLLVKRASQDGIRGVTLTKLSSIARDRKRGPIKETVEA